MVRASVVGEKPIPQIDVSPKKGEAEVDSLWWLQGPDTMHRAVFAVANAIEADQSTRLANLEEWRRLYEDKATTDGRLAGAPANQKPLSTNVVRSCIRRAHNAVAKSKPRPLFLTSEGSASLKSKAQKLTRFNDGLFTELDVYEHAQSAFRDSLIFDGGCVKFWSEDWKSHCERVRVSEILVDEYEAIHGSPSQLHHKRATVSRRRLIAMFPEHRAEIEAAAMAPMNGSPRVRTNDLVVVIESWHLRSGPNEDDGCHAICLENVTLFAEEYTRTSFPFLFLFWDLPTEGFWGSGIAGELQGKQQEINELGRRIQIAQKHMCAPKILCPASTKIAKSHWNNDLRGTVIHYQGNAPPQFATPPAMHAEVYQHRETLKREAFEDSGISQLAAQSKKPGGLDSGVALREFQDIESEGFVIVGQRYEKFFILAARLLIELQRELAERFAELKARAKKAKGKAKAALDAEIDRAKNAMRVKARAGKFIQSIPWTDVSMQDDEFDLEIFPVSMLPKTPAGRLQTITDMMQVKGEDGRPLISGEQAMQLLDFPDLEDIASLKTASLDIIRKIIGDMIEGGPYVSPEPHFNLALSFGIAHVEYLRAMRLGVAEENLEKLRQFMQACLDLQAMGQPAANTGAPPQGLPPGPSMGAGAPMPALPAAPPMPMAS